MDSAKRAHWVMPVISLIVFILTFFIFFRETDELFSSIFAAGFASVLTLGTLITLNWLIRVFLPK